MCGREECSQDAAYKHSHLQQVPSWGSKAGTIAALLLWTCISSFPGTAVLLGAQRGWCFVGGFQPCNIMYCNGGQGLEDAGKGETQQPPAHTQTWGRAGCRLWSGWSSTFGEKKSYAKKLLSFQTLQPGYS